MNNQSSAKFEAIRLSAAFFMVLALWLLTSFAASAAPLTINVVGVDPNGSKTAVTAYRWTVEEDATKPSIPGQPANLSNYSFSFHTSYMPVIAAGRVGATDPSHPTCDLTQTNVPPGCDPDVFRLYKQALPELNAAKRYYVSIAAEGYQMGGAPVPAGATTVTVYLNKYPLPTAQVSVFAFNDNSPINGAPDLPQETGLAGFTVILSEAGGTYGQSGGAVTQDAFANPLGTTYFADGSVKVRGNGIILTDANGVATIKNLFPAKYTVSIIPPVGSDWHQTSTIEGGKGQDAWVKNNEPSFFQEFGPPGHHVFIGFTKSGKLPIFVDNRVDPTTPCASGVPGCVLQNLLNGPHTVTGRVVNTHYSRPPLATFSNAAPVSECWVGLNEANGGRALYATACNKDSTFSIPDVPNGTYELVIWDEPLDMIIGTRTVCVGPPTPTSPDCINAATVALGDQPVASWFGRYQGRVFQDIDGTGLPYFKEDFNRPYIYVDPVTGLEEERIGNFLKGQLKPSFGAGIANNIRFRDGSIYQSMTTKDDGTFAFTEVFPFFNWMVGEIDYARFKATSANVVVDDGGPVDPAANLAKLWGKNPTTPYTGLFGSNDLALAYDPWIRLNPQQQADTECPSGVAPPCYFRTESVEGGPGAILLEGMQTFLGQTNHIEWGKTPYKLDENGGIAGIVYYAITRAEDDPRYAAAENWEPGIPRVQVNVFLDCDADGLPDQPKNDGSGLCSQLSAGGYSYVKPDVDNYPFCWRDPESCGLAADNPQMGPEDRKGVADGAVRTAALSRQATLLGALGTPSSNDFLYGDVIRWGAPGQATTAQTTWGLGKTDSWDDSIPRDCPDSGGKYTIAYGSDAGNTLDCFDGLRNFNQVRPSVFDGGFAFGRVAGQPELPMVIGDEGNGTYIVEAVAPPGYLHQGNGDKNVVFGDTLKAAPAALPHECVGESLDVPPTLTLFPGEPNPNFEAGQLKWRKCDMKAVPLLPGQNAAPNFFMYTEAPVAGHGVGFILDDTSAEFNRFSPNFGEKHSPPHLPVSIQDWTGREISRVYSDEFGTYNFLVPSTFTINPPYPSGVMPSMMVACMNHPGPIKVGVDAYGKDVMGVDPYFNRAYTQFCYTLQYLPGKTTYLDTPVLPVAAFAPVVAKPLDCECQDHTPAIYSATNGDNGPWVPSSGTRQLTIVSVGKKWVLNPAYDPAVPDTNQVIQRDYGFGSNRGTVTLVQGNTTRTPTIDTWSDDIITITLPSGGGNAVSNGAWQLLVRGANGKESVVGVTVHVGPTTSANNSSNTPPKRVNLAGTNGAFKTIQAAIEAASNGDLITVAPGTYDEYVVMDKRVRLQGWGAASTFINAAKSSAAGLAEWRALINRKAAATVDAAGAVTQGSARTFDLLPGQTVGIDPANNEPLLFGAEEAPGILVALRSNSNAANYIPGDNTSCRSTSNELRIDGLTITGADAGGGILASGFACSLLVTNNNVVSNYGTYGGGIRIGHTVLLNGDAYTDAVNQSVSIHHNWVSQNGATEAGGGGGITLGTGSDAYNLANNYVCGNFSMADGGGISHLGHTGGTSTIRANKIIFNQTFNQSADPMGGGLSIAGQAALAGVTTEGTGDVVVDANLIQANQAGAGAGGGVSVARTITGDEINLTNNMIVNNVAAYTGGGVALTDTTTNTNTNNNAAGVRLVNNTVASNVSTATNRQSYGSNPTTPQIGGLAVLSGDSPRLLNNVLWANRSLIYLIDGTKTCLRNPGAADCLGLPNEGTATYLDLGRVGLGAALAPRYSVLTATPTNPDGTVVPSIGCTNTAPTSGNVVCNRYVAPTSTSLFARPNDFSSITNPTQPVVLADTTVLLQSALTFDETGNFINVIFSPLTLWNADGSPRADYHINANSTARNNGRARNTSNSNFNVTLGANIVPQTDFDLEARPDTNNSVDIGADEYRANSISLAITKTNGVTSVHRGDTVTYTIVVTNNGATAANGAVVSDTAPTSLTGASWTCTVTDGAVVTGATCNGTTSTPSGNINATIGTFPPQATVTFVMTGTVASGATSNLTNTATVNLGSSSASATDSDPIIVSGANGTLAPSPLSFGNQLLNSTSAARTVTFTNTGTSAITLRTTGGAVTLTGANATNFAVAAGTTCSNGATVAAAGTCVVNLTFTPNATGSRTATLNLFAGTDTTPFATDNVSGSGVVVSGTLTPKPAAFGDQQVGTTSNAIDVALVNTTGLPLTLRSGTNTNLTNANGPAVAITGSGAGFFAVVTEGTTCINGAVIPDQDACVIKVTFTPGNGTASLTTRNATLSVYAAGATTALDTDSLSGTGVRPQASLAPSSLAFGNQLINTSSAAQSVTVTNTGTGPVTITSQICTGSNGNCNTNSSTANYAQTGTCGAELAPRATCSIDITFTPSATGNRNATLRVAGAASGVTATITPNAVSLTGTGVFPPMHVGDLDAVASQTGTNPWTAMVTVTVHDANENPVSNALVTGNWNGGGGSGNGGTFCTTNGSGQCTLTRANIANNRASQTFTVNNISKAAMSYASGSNHDPDGDSTGTAITVANP